jgi:PEGA domain
MTLAKGDLQMQTLLRSAVGTALALIMGNAARFGQRHTRAKLVSNTSEVGRATDPPSIKASLWSPKSTVSIHAHINSIPAGADIQVDEAYVAATPSDIDLACCWHDVTMIKPGRKPWTRRVRITGGVLKITAHLQKCATNSRYTKLHEEFRKIRPRATDTDTNPYPLCSSLTEL